MYHFYTSDQSIKPVNNSDIPNLRMSVCILLSYTGNHK